MKKDLQEVANIHLRAIGTALAHYIASEGCDCCQNTDKHEIAEKQLAELLNVPKYSDGSGYDFSSLIPKQ